MVSQHTAKFGGPRHCDSGDLMFFVVEGQHSTYPRLDPPLLLSPKHMACHAHTHEISGPIHNKLSVSNGRLSILVAPVSKKLTEKDRTYVKNI